MPPPKKRDKDTSTASTTIPISGSVAVNSVTTPDGAKLNGHQQEQELFLQAFEKPTQIYRYLRNRHSTNPTYLNRTLSYMKDRMSRSNKSRISFKLNGMLSKAFEKTSKGDYLNIIFTGLFDTEAAGEPWWNAGDSVTVDIILYKLTKSKRKDCNTDFQELKVLRSTVIFKPNSDPGHYSAISLPMKGIVTCHNSSLKLAFRISTSLKYLNRKKSKKEDAVENGDLVSKRRSNYKIYGAELRISEKPQDHTQSGIYESLMVELYSAQSLKSLSPRKRTWESLLDSATLESVDPFNDQLTLKFILQWSTNEIPETVAFNDLDKYGLQLAEIKAKNVPNVLTQLPANDVNFNNNCIGSCPGFERQREKLQVVYNFLYSNNMRQQTEYTEDVVCPWCGVDCMRLYALLKHLKLCHGRFNFMYHPSVNGARIDVTLNDAYDGSYAGSPYDLAGPSGSSFARTCGPVRRTSVTNLLVCRPRRQKTGLDEFLVLDEDDLSNQRPYITGHNRLYHHTETCLPVHPKELDIDSEGESDPLWLRQKTIQMIDEFSDVNEGEKELMKLWNLHVMKYGYVGDCQLPLACEMFLDSNGHEIIRKNLYRNFILHMCSLFDYGLVAPETVYKTVQKLQGMLSKYPPGQVLMSQQRAAQLKYWLDVGIHKQDEQRLKSPQKTGPVPLAATPTSVSSLAPDSETGMHPPAKRLAVKRASMHPQHSLSAAEKLNASVTSPSKAVAKKSATQPDEQNRSSGKRSENSAKRMCLPSAAVVGGITAQGRDAGQERDTNSSSNSSHNNNNNNGKAATDKQRNAEAKAAPQATKRKYTHREHPPAKRQRNDSNTPLTASHNSSTTSASATTTMTTTRSSHKLDTKAASASTAASGANSTSATMSSSAVSSSQITTTTTITSTSALPKRLITRRQSMCATEAATSQGGVAGGKVKHGLRSRHSLEKR